MNTMNNNTISVISAKTLSAWRSFLSITAAVLVLASCEINEPTPSRGKQIDGTVLENRSLSLGSIRTSRNTVHCVMTEGNGVITEGLRATINTPSSFDQTVVLKADPSLVESYAAETGREYLPLPETFYSFENGGTLLLSAGKTSSELARLTCRATNSLGNRIKAGHYLLPVVAAASAGEMSRDVVYYDITVREKFEEGLPLYDDLLMVFYLNTSQYDPRLITDYNILKSDISSGIDTYITIGNIVNLRKTTVTYEPATGRALLTLSSDMKYVLDNYTTYILPVQETERKVCLSIEGGNTGLGFCNMTDAQIEDFASQVKLLFATYNLDGVNLWDRNSEYGKEGMPLMNTTSYPKLVKALRDVLGPDKLLTLTDHEEPTEYFWDTEATGGIEVGKYLDYAWTGYCDEDYPFEIVDPYHPDDPNVSKEHIRKPIAGLDATKYGCINAPWQKGTADMIFWESNGKKVAAWNQAGYEKSHIILHADMRTHLQDEYEHSWDPTIVINYMTDEGIIHNDNGTIAFVFDKNDLRTIVGGSGYNKWKKDW